MFTAQPLSRQYWTCPLICSSVRSGRKEKQPWVMRMIWTFQMARLQTARTLNGKTLNSETLNSETWRRNEVRCIRRVVVEGDVLPDFQRLAQRRAGLRCLRQDLRTLMDVVAALVAGED